MNTSKMMTSKEVGEALDVSHMTIYNWREQKQLKSHKDKGSRLVFFDPKEVVALAKSRGVKLTLTQIAQIISTRAPTKPGPKAGTKTSAKVAVKRRVKASMKIAADKAQAHRRRVSVAKSSPSNHVEG